MKQLGLIGYPLSHSFSKKYFFDKFVKEQIEGFHYDLFPLSGIHELTNLLNEKPNLVGFNITIPYKEQVIPFLDEMSKSAKAIGAVNTVIIEKGKLKGYNTDVYGFEVSMWLRNLVILIFQAAEPTKGPEAQSRRDPKIVEQCLAFAGV